jgi:hypothetical protein
MYYDAEWFLRGTSRKSKAVNSSTRETQHDSTNPTVLACNSTKSVEYLQTHSCSFGSGDLQVPPPYAPSPDGHITEDAHSLVPAYHPSDTNARVPITAHPQHVQQSVPVPAESCQVPNRPVNRKSCHVIRAG